MKIALIVSENQEVREKFISIFEKTGFSYILESQPVKAVSRVLELSLSILVLDMEAHFNEQLAFVRLMRKLRPRLPVLVVANAYNASHHRVLLQEEVHVCSVRNSDAGVIEKDMDHILYDALKTVI